MNPSGSLQNRENLGNAYNSYEHSPSQGPSRRMAGQVGSPGNPVIEAASGRPLGRRYPSQKGGERFLLPSSDPEEIGSHRNTSSFCMKPPSCATSPAWGDRKHWDWERPVTDTISVSQSGGCRSGGGGRGTKSPGERLPSSPMDMTS